MGDEWQEDWSSLTKRAADPGDPSFEGFIDAKHENGLVFRRIYRTPMGRMVSLDDGPIPDKGRFTHWRESSPA